MLVGVLVALALYYYLYVNDEGVKEGFRNRGGGRAGKVFNIDGNRYGMRGGALPRVGTTIRMPELGNDVFTVSGRQRGRRGRKSGRYHNYDYVILQPSGGYVYGDYYAPYNNVLWELYPPPYGYDYYPYPGQYGYPTPITYPSYNIPWWWIMISIDHDIY
jgi:hypothetical protein